MTDQTTDLTQKALDTLAFFGWVVIDEKEHTLTVAKDINFPYVTDYALLNEAALSADERQQILDSDDPESRNEPESQHIQSHVEWLCEWAWKK
jgi:hypothetical protein